MQAFAQIALILAAAPFAVSPAALTPGRAAAFAFEDAKRIAAADKLRLESHEASEQTPKLPYEPDAPFMRYFWVTTPAKHLDDFLIAFCTHLNILSTKGVIKWPTLIAPDVARIDLRDYFDLDKLIVWEKTAAVDFVFHQKMTLLKDATIDHYWPGGLYKPASADAYERVRGVVAVEHKSGETLDQPAYAWLPAGAIDGLRKLTYSESPILMAEWFFVQSARQTSLTNDEKPGIGYQDFLGIKKRDDFFRLTGVDPKVASKVFAEWRAVVTKSGISRQNRQVVVFGGASGKAFGTLDTFTQKGKGVALRNLRPAEFAHNAEEWIGRKGNGLWVTALFNDKGLSQPSAPDKIGPDDSPLNKSRDTRVHDGLSCIRCHWVDKDGLKPIDDWARKTLRQTGLLRLIDADKKVVLELESLYLRDLDEILDDERKLYARGIARATASKKNPKGLSPAAVGKLYAQAWDRYAEDDLSAADAARELGVTERALLDGIKKHASKENRGGTDLVLASFLDDQKLTRLDWEDSYALAMTLARGLKPPEIPKTEKVKEEFPKDKKGK